MQGGEKETDAALNGLRYTLKDGSYSSLSSTCDTVSTDHGRIYFVTYGISDSNYGRTEYYNTIECGLYNMSYNVDFTFSNGQPSLSIINATRLNGVASDAAVATCGPANGKFVCSPQAAAYFAMLNAFGEQLLGYLQQSYSGSILSVRTQVAKTVLMDTKELYDTQYYMNSGESADTRPANAMVMAEALEEVFTNATLSLFSRTAFLYVLDSWHSVTDYNVM